MYNTGRFNSIPFNANRNIGQYIDRTRNLGEIVEAVIGEQLALSRTRHMNERVNGSLELSIIMPRKRAIEEVIHNADIEIQTIGWRTRTASERISSSARLGKYIHQSRAVKETLNTGVIVGKYMHTARHSGETITGQPHLGKHMHIGRAMHDNIHNLMRVAIKRYQQFYIDATIPPGAEIRVNSNNFTVFLVHNGQTINLRPRFTGDWIHFDRGTQRLYVENEGTHMLSGDVLYNDRWL